ncbi:MAG: hypothetical protein JSC189_000346 [Candidatus Tokpelaia sp. JSC189]|nr:MAG: hypothetical protein JSC189_000346 [Candidatus Tokpelaia sp. JSC189]
MIVILIDHITTNYEARSLQKQVALTRKTLVSQKCTAKLTQDKSSVSTISDLNVNNREAPDAYDQITRIFTRTV